MIWLAVFPTLTVLNLALGDRLRTLTPFVRTFVLATIAVPIVAYALMPQLHRLRRRLLTSTASDDPPTDSTPSSAARSSTTTTAAAVAAWPTRSALLLVWKQPHPGG